MFNRDGRVFIGRRIDGPEHIDETHVWQMPQGGIDAARTPGRRRCASSTRRPTSARSTKLGEIDDWLTYDIPRDIVGQAWKGKYRGQTQKWYALRFTGEESEIDIAHPAGGHEPEFAAWRWEPVEIPRLVVPFKRPVYERVVKEFARFRESTKRRVGKIANRTGAVKRSARAILPTRRAAAGHLSRPSTSVLRQPSKTWMPGTRPHKAGHDDRELSE